MELYEVDIGKKVAVVSYDELLEVVTESYYKQLAFRHQLTVLRRGCRGCKALIEYDSLPERIKEKYDEVFPQAYADATQKMKAEESKLAIDSEAREYFAAVRIGSASLPLDTQRQYTANASVLGAMVRVFNETTAMRKAGGSRPEPYNWRRAYEVAEQYRGLTTFPKTERKVRDLFNKFRKEGYGVLIHQGFGNSCARKADDEVVQYLVALKRQMSPRLTNTQIVETYNKRCKRFGMQPLDEKTIVNTLNRPSVKALWLDTEQGEQAARIKLQRKMKTELPTLPNALWYGDGTKLNLYYKDYEDGRLVVKTTSVYEVCDAASEALIGCYISDSENYEAQYRAFRAATDFAGVKPYEVVTDNQGGHKKLDAMNFFDTLATLSRRTAPYNGASKTIENIFGRFQQQVLHRWWYFTGQNVTAKSDKSKANAEFINQNKEKLPTLGELKEIYMRARDMWNNMAHPKHKDKTRLEVYRGKQNPDCEKMTEAEYINIFWKITDRPSRYTSAGIKMKVDGTEYAFEVLTDSGTPDLEFLNDHNGDKYFIQYDPLNVTKVRLLKENAMGQLVYVTEAKPYITIHRALQDQTSEERSFIVQQLERDKEMRVKRVLKGREMAAKYGTDYEQQGLNAPKILGLNMRKKIEEEIDLGRATKKLSYEDENIDILNKI